MFIDLHILQTVPLANLNRDDVGSPKTLPYGGTRRLRVSSQAWKRAARESMEQQGLAGCTYRTRHPDVRLAEKLVAAGFNTDTAADVAKWTFNMLGTAAKKEGKNVILFASDAELDSLAELLTAHTDHIEAAHTTFEPPTKKPSGKEWAGPQYETEGLAKKDITRVFTGATHADAVGLFGRMLADDATINVDAAVQVAHAMGTHAVEIEFDYFTAAEDIPIEDEGSGAAMIESAEFASSTLYRYATIDVEELLRNCGGDAVAAAAVTEAFIAAFALSMPSGKKNSTAPNSTPALVHAVVRSDRPVSYSGAFESAVRAKGGFEAPSVAALVEYAQRAGRFVATPTYEASVNASTADTTALGENFGRFDDLGTAVVEAVYRERL